MLRTIGQFWTVSFSLRTKVSQTLQSVLCITTNKYLAVLLHVRFSVVGPIPFLLAAFFSLSGLSLYITTYTYVCIVTYGPFKQFFFFMRSVIVELDLQSLGVSDTRFSSFNFTN